jgi:hypothetical protein
VPISENRDFSVLATAPNLAGFFGVTVRFTITITGPSNSDTVIVAVSSNIVSINTNFTSPTFGVPGQNPNQPF